MSDLSKWMIFGFFIVFWLMVFWNENRKDDEDDES